MRKAFLGEHDTKAEKPLRACLILLVWAIVILGPAQDLSVLTSTGELAPFLIARYGVLFPFMVMLLLPLLPRAKTVLLRHHQLLWAGFVAVMIISEISIFPIF
jgi:hypothetical protein